MNKAFINRDKFLDKLLNNCLDLEWTRENQDLISIIKNPKSSSGYKIRCGCSRDGDFIQIIPSGSYNGPSINESEDPRVSEIRDKIWEHINNLKNDKIWADALQILNNL